MKRVYHYFLLIICLVVLNVNTYSKPYPPKNKLYITVNSNFIQADNESDNLISKDKIYSRSDALELRKNLENQLQNNPNSIAISLALVKFHTAASATNGGFMGLALRYATNILRQDDYIGCLAFEYIYTHYGDFKNAEVWYNNSLRCLLPSGMEISKNKFRSTLGCKCSRKFF